MGVMMCMTEKRFQIIHLGNAYDFVIKDHITNKTYGTFQGETESMEELLEDMDKEIQDLKQALIRCAFDDK